MIKAEVVFEDGEIHLNGFEITIEEFSDRPFDIFKNGNWVKSFRKVEEAIAFCLEHKA